MPLLKQMKMFMMKAGLGRYLTEEYLTVLSYEIVLCTYNYYDAKSGINCFRVLSICKRNQELRGLRSVYAHMLWDIKDITYRKGYTNNESLVTKKYRPMKYRIEEAKSE